MRFQDGDIILEKVNDFGAWYNWVLANGIQFFDGVYYHHALIAFDNYLYEAQQKVVVSEPSRLNGSEVLVLRLRDSLTDKERFLFERELFRSLGKKYDYTGTLFFQLLHIFCFRRIWLGRTNKKARRRYYCTELVADLTNKVRGYFPEPWKTGPSTIMKLAPLYYTVVYEGKYENYTGK